MDSKPDKYASFLYSLKKYFPYAFLIILTIVLMFFFKHNRREIGEMLEEGKSNLLAFYSQNLRPLLFRTQISEEDIFNFALYQSLPLDKEKNKILVLNNENSGSQVYEVRTLPFNPSTNNYESFVKYMGLNNKEKGEADSILNSYKKEIYSSVFVNDKNTFAVNPKINQLQQAVLADLINFSQSVNRKKAEEIFHKSFTGSERGDVANLITSARQTPNNEFILMTPDTVAKTSFAWNQNAFNKQLAELEKNKELALKKSQEFDVKLNLAPVIKTAAKSIPQNYSFTVDSNMYKVVIPDEAHHITQVVHDSLSRTLREVAFNLRKMSKELKRQFDRNKINIKIPVPPEAGSTYGHSEPVIIDPYEIVNLALDGLSKADFSELEKYGIKLDSLNKLNKPGMRDSIKKKIKEDMERMRREMKRKQTQSRSN